MSLTISRVELSNFRNWGFFELEPHPLLTVLVGPNAVGKTSVIEAVQLLTQAVSFKRPSWADTVRWGEREARLSLVAAGGGRHLETELVINESGRRTYEVNGKIRRKLSEVSGIIPCVAFTPDDLGLVKNSADSRRQAIDTVGSQLSPAYLKARQEYDRVLRQRNSLLKEGSRSLDNEVWDELLVDSGTRMTEYRIRLFNRLKDPAEKHYRELAPTEELSMRYVPCWERDGTTSSEEDIRASLSGHLQQKAAEEIARRTTLTGPHRDDIEFLIGGKNARVFASQGQQRTISLAWKLAEVSVMREIATQPPVLLLDDVMSELDQSRRDALAVMVGSAAQTLVTTTNLGYFDLSMIERSLVVNLS